MSPCTCTPVYDLPATCNMTGSLVCWFMVLRRRQVMAMTICKGATMNWVLWSRTISPAFSVVRILQEFIVVLAVIRIMSWFITTMRQELPHEHCHRRIVCCYNLCDILPLPLLVLPVTCMSAVLCLLCSCLHVLVPVVS